MYCLCLTYTSRRSVEDIPAGIPRLEKNEISFEKKQYIFNCILKDIQGKR